MKKALIEGMKIVTADEMARLEREAIQEGLSDTAFMENAGLGIASATEEFIEAQGLSKVVTLFVGKGNNGGDAFAAGVELIKRGFSVFAWHIYPLEVCSPLCKLMHERFLSQGGSIHIQTFDPQGVILDGLVGTGFHGAASDILATAIQSANQSGLPILSIDIPSGVNGNTGVVETVAIHAKMTLFLEFPKSGFFLNQGWDHVGTLQRVTFDLPEKYRAHAAAMVHLFNDSENFLPPIKRTRHKYQAGYVLAIAGSLGMPGAAILSSYAALRSGAGIVRLFHPQQMRHEFSAAPYELIREEWDGKNLHRVIEESKRARALLIGPAIGRDAAAESMCLQVLSQLNLPTVIDADALFHLSKNPHCKLPAVSILTPHRGEMEQLLTQEPDLQACQAFAEEKQVTLVLKGAPTFIFHPRTSPLCIPHGDPGMATAGSGDVLTGMIAALLAQNMEARKAAAVGVYLHAMAGAHAAEELTSYCMTASDLLEFIPEAFLETL